MREEIRNYLLSVVTVSMLTAVMQSFFPKGSSKKLVSWIGGLLILMSVVSPLMQLDPADISRAISKMQIAEETRRTGIAIGNRDLLQKIIKERCETYILDKADQMGLPLQVEVQMDQGTDYPYPKAVTLYGTANSVEQMKLKRLIEENLGIPIDRQEWILK